MPIFEPWTIVKVPFPYTNRSTWQNRPALVIAAGIQAGGPDFIWTVMITSTENRSWAGDIEISDIAQTGLTAPSMIRPMKIVAIESSHASFLGTLPMPDRQPVADFIMRFLSPLYAELLH